MTATTLLISGGLTIVGTLLGVVLGLFGDRYLRGRGNLRCSLVNKKDCWYPTDPSIDNVEDFKDYAVDITYDLSFFNEKEIDHGLYSIEVVFLANGDEARLGSSTSQEGLKTVNLAARQWSTTSVTGRIEGPSSRLVRDWQTIEVRGVFPDHSSFRQTVMKHAGATIPSYP
jgi:hypothetical protein